MVQVWVPLVHSPSRDGQAALEAALEALEALALTLSKTLSLISLALEFVLSGAQDCKVLNQNAPQSSGGAQGRHLRTDRCKVAQWFIEGRLNNALRTDRRLRRKSSAQWLCAVALRRSLTSSARSRRIAACRASAMALRRGSAPWLSPGVGARAQQDTGLPGAELMFVGQAVALEAVDELMSLAPILKARWA